MGEDIPADCTEPCRPYAVPGLDGYVDTCHGHARRAAWDTLLDCV